MSLPASVIDKIRLTQGEVDRICAKHDRLWAGEPGGMRATFAGCDLSHLDLRGRNLVDVDFFGAVLAYAGLDQAVLDRAEMQAVNAEGVKLTRASLRKSDLRGASLRQAHLAGADLFEANLGSIDQPPTARAGRRTGAVRASHADFSGADLTRAKLTGMKAEEANFSGAILHQARMQRGCFQGANFTSADLAMADLRMTDLKDATLDRAILSGACMDERLRSTLFDSRGGSALRENDDNEDLHARLEAFRTWVRTEGRTGAVSTFAACDLRRLDLRGFDLSAMIAPQACFYGMDLTDCCLAGADLRQADLRYSKLTGVDLRGARLNGALLDYAELQGVTCVPLAVPGYEALVTDLRGVSAHGAQFTASEIAHARLDFYLADALQC